MNFDLILLDIETQQDLFLPKGSLYTPGAESARYSIYKLFDWAKANDQPVISTVLRVPAGRRGPLSELPHCREGTNGEKKLSKTVLSPYVNLGSLGTTDLPRNLFNQYRQVIFEKRSTDIFEHQRAERLITELSNVSFVICGGGVHAGIVEAAVGLRNRGFGVVLAEDAVADLGDEQAGYAYQRMQAKGVLFVETDRIIAPKPRQLATAAFRSSDEVLRR